jgi:hypothetical protein
MPRTLLFTILLCLFAVSASAQQADTTATTAKQLADTTVVAPPQTQLQTTPPPQVQHQTTPPPTTPPPAAPPKAAKSGPKRVYYGGTVGVSFGDYTRFSIVPFVGYKLTPRLHVGGKVGYEYIDGDNYSSSNYGGSLFSRLLVSPRLYAHGEFAYFSYKYNASGLETDRFWVPFLYVGGGLIQPMGRNASAYVEVLFDVLQDEDSPYDNWEPFISVGVGVGF